jgi:hypothetical protein
MVSRILQQREEQATTTIAIHLRQKLSPRVIHSSKDGTSMLLFTTENHLATQLFVLSSVLWVQI